MVIGAAGELPKPPEKPVVFLEGESLLRNLYELGCADDLGLDMDESQIAEAVRHHFHFFVS